MQNCYNKRYGVDSQVPLEALIDQDDRLRRNQVENLNFVQEIARTNKELAARIKTLEEKIMDCSRTHVDLASADRMVSEAKAESLKRADEINRKLMEQHQQEVLELAWKRLSLIQMNGRIHSHAEEEKLWCSLKQSLQAEVFKSQKVIEDLRHEKEDQLNKINELREEINRLRQESTEEAAALRETNGNLLEELGRSRATSDELSRLQLDMAASKQAKQELQFQIERLAADLEEARAERAGEQLKVAQEEIKVLKAKNDQLTALVPGLRQKWEDSERRFAEERDALGTRAEAAEAEVQRLEAAVAAATTAAAAAAASAEKRRGSNGSTPNFREFVGLKREVATLREENLALKEQLRPPGAKPLPPISSAPRHRNSLGKI